MSQNTSHSQFPVYVLIFVLAALAVIMVMIRVRPIPKADTIVTTDVQQIPTPSPVDTMPEIATDPQFKEAKGSLLSGIPSDIPTYPGATLVGSAEVSPQGQPNAGYRIKWDSNATVKEVISFYEKELSQRGWTFTPPNDRKADGEQVARIQNRLYTGYVAAELEGDVTEIVIDIRTK